MSVWKELYHKFFRVKTALFSIFANNYFHIIRLISINIISYVFIRMINFQMYLKILIWDSKKWKVFFISQNFLLYLIIFSEFCWVFGTLQFEKSSNNEIVFGENEKQIFQLQKFGTKWRKVLSFFRIRPFFHRNYKKCSFSFLDNFKIYIAKYAYQQKIYFHQKKEK